MEVYIKNFRSISDSNYQLQNGITLIKGVSGKGKSTILEAIRWCIFGNNKNVYPFGEKKPSNNYTKVKIVFNNMQIIRTKPPEMLKVICGEEEYIKTEAEQFIIQHIGKKNLWQSCCYISQGERNILMNLTNNEKMELIKEIVFSHEEEKIEKYNKNIKNYLSKINEKIIKQEGKISYGKNIIEELSKEDIENKYLEFKSKIENFQSFKYLEDRKKNINREKINNEKNIEKNKLLEHKQKIYLQAKVKIKKYPFKLNFDIIDKWKKYIQAKKYLVNNTFIPVEETLEQLINYKNIVINNSTIPNVNKSLLSYEIEQIKKYNLFLKEKNILKNYQIERKKIVYELEEIEIYIEKKFNTTDIEKLKYYVENSVENKLFCPKCNCNLTIKNNKLVQTESIQLSPRDKIKIIQQLKEHDNLSEKLKEIAFRINNVNLEKINKPDNLDLQGKEKLLEKIESYIPVKYTLEEIEKKIIDLKNYQEYQKQDKIIKDNYMKEFDIYSYPENIQSYYNQYLISEQNINEYEEFVKLNGDKFFEVKSLIFYNKEIEEIDKKLSLISEYTYISKKYKDWKNIIEKQNKLTEEYDLLNKEQESCNKIKNLISQATNETLENLLYQLNNDISEIVNEFFDNAQLKISMFKKVKNQFKPHFSFSIIINNNVYDNINNLSGGEKDRFSIALTLALNKHFNFPFIMLDECMSSLDQDNREKCLEIIKKYAKDKLILNVCHETIEGYYDNIIVV